IQVGKEQPRHFGREAAEHAPESARAYVLEVPVGDRRQAAWGGVVVLPGRDDPVRTREVEVVCVRRVVSVPRRGELARSERAQRADGGLAGGRANPQREPAVEEAEGERRAVSRAADHREAGQLKRGGA